MRWRLNESDNVTEDTDSIAVAGQTRYNRFLLVVAGLGGLLYGIDVGIIAGALPYLEATSGLNASQLSIIVAVVLLGSVISTLFAGMLADWMGRRRMMAVSGMLFVGSIPMIALAHSYGPLVVGRLLQGMSAGLIGVVVPLYLAECLSAGDRGKGTGVFQGLLTLGLVAAAVIGMYLSIRVEEVAKLGDADMLFVFKDRAWRSNAAFFLPTVGKWGYSNMFFAFAGCTGVYFITAAFFLPETKGKTLEEIEEHFEGKHHRTQ